MRVTKGRNTNAPKIAKNTSENTFLQAAQNEGNQGKLYLIRKILGNTVTATTIIATNCFEPTFLSYCSVLHLRNPIHQLAKLFFYAA